MKKTILTLALVSLVTFTSCKKETESTTQTIDVTEVVSNPDYKVDTSNSMINWMGSKPAGQHTGTIVIKEGSFAVANGKIDGGEFTIDMNSINVTDLEGDDKAALEGHLKGIGEKEKEDHFFNVNKFPTSNFKILNVEEQNGTYFVKGALTMKDITKEINFPAKITVSENEVTLVSEPFKINRTNWGVNYASKSIFDDLKDKFVDDDMEIQVKVVATK